MTCKGICINHEAVKRLRGYRYIEGQKRCQICCVFLIWDGAFCPCCGMRLRTGHVLATIKPSGMK
jgi:hypothetical protein